VYSVSVLQGTVCPEGDACSYTHNVYEAWLHPSRCACQAVLAFLLHPAVLRAVHTMCALPRSSC
jgi:hypothetical protein